MNGARYGRHSYSDASETCKSVVAGWNAPTGMELLLQPEPSIGVLDLTSEIEKFCEGARLS